MTTRQEIFDYGLTFKGAYVDTPFRDENGVLLRYTKKHSPGHMSETEPFRIEI